MNCDVIKDLIPMYIEGRCSEASGQTVEEHLNTCAECKKLYEDMKSSKETDLIMKAQNKIKKRKTILITSAITLSIIIIVGIYWCMHPTHYLYNDSWIIGKNETQIIDRYGAFDEYIEIGFSDEFERGYLVKPVTYDPWFHDPIAPEYYMIYFDENGIAYDVGIEEEKNWGL